MTPSFRLCWIVSWNRTLFSGRLLLNFEFAPTLTKARLPNIFSSTITLAEPIPVLLLSIGVLREEVLDRVPVDERERAVILLSEQVVQIRENDPLDVESTGLLARRRTPAAPSCAHSHATSSRSPQQPRSVGTSRSGSLRSAVIQCIVRGDV